MAIDLDQTLSWTQAHAATSPAAAAQLAMLHDLQGNILKGHGRHFTSNIFVRFDPARAGAARRFLASVGHDVTSALDQLLGAEAHKSAGTDAGAFITVLLAAAGYDALGRADAKPPGAAFNAGMGARQLNDPPAAQWELALVAPHALILVAASDPAWRNSERQAILARIAATGGAVVHAGYVDGNALFNRGDGLGIEHFGYVDGRSQPLALQEDVDHQAANGGIDQWNPAIVLRQLLVRCPGGALDVSHGSFFVFRKLEQNVRGFKLREEELAEALDAERAAKGLPVEPVGERAGASVVGRFENGTPVSLDSNEVPLPARSDDAVRNNFNFSADQQGLKCPYAAHIRKSNPRDDAPNSKSHLMARRGIPYGRRDDDPNDGQTDNKPTGGVGLLFMAYQADIEDQFEFTQNAWVNNPQFARPLLRPGPATGIDPVIGQKPTPLPEPPIPGQIYPLEYGRQLSDRPFDFSEFVRMRGGEYLFAPAISFLKALT